MAQSIPHETIPKQLKNKHQHRLFLLKKYYIQLK